MKSMLYHQTGFIDEPPIKHYDKHYIYLRTNIIHNEDETFDCDTLQIMEPSNEDISSDFDTLWSKYYPLTEEGQKLSQDLALADLAEALISQEV